MVSHTPSQGIPSIPSGPSLRAALQRVEVIYGFGLQPVGYDTSHTLGILAAGGVGRTTPQGCGANPASHAAKARQGRPQWSPALATEPLGLVTASSPSGHLSVYMFTCCFRYPCYMFYLLYIQHVFPTTLQHANMFSM